MRQSVAILWYSKDYFGKFRWELVRKITWPEYLDYSKTVSGEGKEWKAVII
jgi:hypothetical protein